MDRGAGDKAIGAKRRRKISAMTPAEARRTRVTSNVAGWHDGLIGLSGSQRRHLQGQSGLDSRDSSSECAKRRL